MKEVYLLFYSGSMTNEDKILPKLDQLTRDVSEMRADVGGLTTITDSLTTKVDGLTTKFTTLENQVAELPTRDEVPTLEQVREVVKEEVRSEVSSQLEIKLTEKLAALHEKMDENRQTAKDDADALGAAEANQNRRLD